MAGAGCRRAWNRALTGRVLVEVSKEFYRPTDVVNLLGDPAKARTVLGWNPQATTYEQLVERMARHDRALAEAEDKGRRA